MPNYLFPRKNDVFDRNWLKFQWKRNRKIVYFNCIYLPNIKISWIWSVYRRKQLGNTEVTKNSQKYSKADKNWGHRENWELGKVIAIGEKYGKSAGQILIKFQVQRKIAVIPKDSFQSKFWYFNFPLGEKSKKFFQNVECNEHMACKWREIRFLKVKNGHLEIALAVNFDIKTFKMVEMVRKGQKPELNIFYYSKMQF